MTIQHLGSKVFLFADWKFLCLPYGPVMVATCGRSKKDSLRNRSPAGKAVKCASSSKRCQTARQQFHLGLSITNITAITTNHYQELLESRSTKKPTPRNVAREKRRFKYEPELDSFPHILWPISYSSTSQLWICFLLQRISAAF